jgi:enamine deaminase RidA (YjgF/YER057c/UK114 family)
LPTLDATLGGAELEPTAGVKALPLSFATRLGDLLFISGIPGFDPNGALPMSSNISACWMSQTQRSANSSRSMCCHADRD